jgi:hypothetical protein
MFSSHRIPVSSLFAVAFMLISAFSPVHAENPIRSSAGLQTQNPCSPPSLLELNSAYLKGYLDDAKRISISPFHWQKRDWITASLTISATVGLYSLDSEIQEESQKNRNRTSNTIAGFAKHFGDGEYSLPPLGILYLYGHFKKDERAQDASLLSLESFLLSGILTQTIKTIAHRDRPSSGDPYNEWDGPGWGLSDLSFPSGHASAAFSVATVIASEYNDHAYIPPIVYGLATLTALSRINDNDHWSSDVFFGAAIGYFTARAILNAHYSGKMNNLTLYPVLNGRQVSLTIARAF